MITIPVVLITIITKNTNSNRLSSKTIFNNHDTKNSHNKFNKQLIITVMALRRVIMILNNSHDARTVITISINSIKKPKTPNPEPQVFLAIETL